MPNCSSGTCNAEFLTKFITLYRKSESLWRIKAKIYYDRPRKRRDYQELVKLMQTVDPDCTADDVKKKINSLRSSFRKELKKVEASVVNRDEEPYVPKLWYFNQLLFLKEIELQDGNNAASEASTSMSIADAEDDFDAVERKFFEHDDPLDWDESSTNQDEPEPEPTSSNNTRTTRTTRTNENTEHNVKKQSDTRKRVIADRVFIDEDQNEVLSKHIALKLHCLSKDQKIHAEKLINDVLYEGQLNNLTRKAKVVVEQDSVDYEDSKVNQFL